jgi:hypothetical protein
MGRRSPSLRSGELLLMCHLTNLAKLTVLERISANRGNEAIKVIYIGSLHRFLEIDCYH